MPEIKEKLKNTIYENSDKIIEYGDKILNNPELGYCEEDTSALVRAVFDEIEIEYKCPLALTGVKATLRGKSDKYNICIIGEMDALKCAGHPNADSDSNAHDCGHNTQVAAMLAAEVTDSNAAFFDVANGFAGCIAGLHEILRQQGLMENILCLNPEEGLSKGQLEELERVHKAYPHLCDDDFIKENIDAWKAEIE